MPLDRRILELFIHQPKMRWDARLVSMQTPFKTVTKEAIQTVLYALAGMKLIESVAGDKYKLGKNIEATDALLRLEHQDEPLSPNRHEDKERKPRSQQIIEGIVDMTRSGAAFILSEELEKDVFVGPNRLGGAFNGDKVRVRWWLNHRNRIEGEVQKVLQRNNQDFIGTLVLSRMYAFVTPDDPKVPMDIAVDRQNLRGAVTGDKVVVRIRRWPDGRGGQMDAPQGEVVLVLGKAGTSDIEMQSILLQAGFNLLFPEEVQRESEAIPDEIPAEEIAKRRDMRGITTFTIDPETAKDFDDALSLRQLPDGNYEVGVHIADVTYYVRPGSALDHEAARRTTSVYLVDRVLPMLPEKISNGVCSLRPHEDKLTFSAIFTFSPEGKLLGEWFGKTIIHSDRRFAYEEAQAILEAGEGEFAEELLWLNELAHGLRRERFAKGSINFETPEVRFKLDDNTAKPLSVYVKERKDAHMLIEDFMLLANKRTAAFIDHHFEMGNPKIPFVYRIHDSPDMDKVMNFANFAEAMGYKLKVSKPSQVGKAYGAMLKKAEGKPESAVLQQLAIRTMAKAAYSTKNVGHYGLAFDTYTHFTSPIRRYSDVLSHRILDDYIQGRNVYAHNATKLEDLCKHISRKERKAMEAERESVKYKQAEFMLDQVGRVYEGIISGMAEHAVFVELKVNFCEGVIRYDNMYDFFRFTDNYYIKGSKRSYKMGDTVWVRVLGVDMQRRQIDMELLDEANDSEVLYLLAEQAKQPAPPKAKAIRKPKKKLSLAEVMTDGGAKEIDQHSVVKAIDSEAIPEIALTLQAEEERSKEPKLLVPEPPKPQAQAKPQGPLHKPKAPVVEAAPVEPLEPVAEALDEENEALGQEGNENKRSKTRSRADRRRRAKERQRQEQASTLAENKAMLEAAPEMPEAEMPKAQAPKVEKAKTPKPTSAKPKTAPEPKAPEPKAPMPEPKEEINERGLPKRVKKTAAEVLAELEAEKQMPKPAEVPKAPAKGGKKVAPKAPVAEVPKVVEAPKTPAKGGKKVAPKAPVAETPKAEETPKPAEAPKAPAKGGKKVAPKAPVAEAPKVEEAPKVAETPKPAEAPKAPAKGGKKVAPKAPVAEAPKVEETPKPAEAPKAPAKGGKKVAPKAPVAEAPKVEEAPKVAEAPKAEVTKPVAEAPKAPAKGGKKVAPKTPVAEASKVVEAPKVEEAKPAEAPKAPAKGGKKVAPKAPEPKVEEAPKTPAKRGGKKVNKDTPPQA